MKKIILLILSLLIMFSLISCKKDAEEESSTSAIIINESNDESSINSLISEDESSESEKLKTNNFFDLVFLTSEKWSIMEQDEARLIYFDNQVGSVKISISSEYNDEPVAEYTQDDLKNIAEEMFASYSSEMDVKVLTDKKINTIDIGGQIAVELEFDINVSTGGISQDGKIIFSIVKYGDNLYYIDYNVPLEYVDQVKPTYDQFIKDISF